MIKHHNYSKEVMFNSITYRGAHAPPGVEQCKEEQELGDVGK